MPVISLRKWKRGVTGASRWVCPSCREITVYPHKCTACRCKASLVPELCNTFVRRQGHLIPVFEALQALSNDTGATDK